MSSGKERRTSFFLLSAVLIVFFVAAMLHFNLYKNYRSKGSFISSMLYLPSGKYLKPVSFGYDTLFADFIYLWSIQYYGDPGFHPRMEYLKHTYDLITELDPHYLDAYQTGALFMFYEGRNPMAGLRLLEKGMRNNPTEWILPIEAGFYCHMNLKRYDLAANYFEKASKVPGTVAFAKRALASMKFKMGDRATSLALWSEIYETADSPSIKQTAYQHVHDLRVLIDLDTIRKAIRQFQEEFNHPPLNLDQLVSRGHLKQVPVDPDGNPYLYNPRTGYVSYSSRLTLYKRYQ
jgi:tetratricopeptide (TPR) repeat protein